MAKNRDTLTLLAMVFYRAQQERKVDIENIELPAGCHIQKTGGRPKKDAKFIAIAVAHFWLTKYKANKVYQAEEWILEKWGSHGITDNAHVRCQVRRMTNGLMAPLRRVIYIELPSFNGLMVKPIQSKNGWIWHESMIEAVQCEIDMNIEITQEK